MTHQEKEFRDGNILSLLIRFSIPATFAILIGIIYNVTDRYYIGQAVGRNGISALAVTFPILLVLSATGVLFSIGGCALAGIKMGEEKIEDARKVLGTCFFALIAIGAVYTIFGMLFLEEIVSFMGATENSFGYAVEYNKYLFPVTIFQLIYITYCSFVRLEGRPMESMVINLASAIVNIILDYILIMRYGMGMKGAAIATAVANVVPGVILIYYLFNYFTLCFSFNTFRSSSSGTISSFRKSIMILSTGITPAVITIPCGSDILKVFKFVSILSRFLSGTVSIKVQSVPGQISVFLCFTLASHTLSIFFCTV